MGRSPWSSSLRFKSLIRKSMFMDGRDVDVDYGHVPDFDGDVFQLFV